MDIIPCRPSKIPSLIESGQLPIDAAFIQVTPPNPAGYCSLGWAIDVAVQAMEQASLCVAEIAPQMPFTFGDTFVPFSEFDMFVESTEPLIYHPRPIVDDVTDRIAANLASIIEDGSCIAFYLLQMLIRQARKNRIKGFIASVNESNGAMIRVFKKSGLTVESRLEDGIFSITMHFP